MFPRTSRQPDRSRRGVALVLVMACVAAAVILGLAFLTTSSVGTRGAQTATDYYRARHIAESGLDMVTRYTDANPMWRDYRTNGQWVSNFTLDGGQFSAHAHFTSDLREPLYVTITSRFGDARHKLEGRLMTVGHAWGAAVRDSIIVKNQSEVDAFDSSVGPYSLSNSAPGAVLTTAATYAGAVQLENFAHIKGDVWIGAGGNPTTVVSQAATCDVTGTVQPLPSSLAFPSPPLMPTDTGANLGNATFSGGTTIISANRQYDDLVISVSGQVRITGNVTVRVNKAFTMSGHGVLSIDPGSKLTLYVGEAINFKDFAEANHTGDTPRLLIHGLGTGYTHVIENQVHVCGAIIAPNSTLTVQNQANFYGVFVGRNLNVQDSGYMHVDRNPALLGSDTRLPVYPTGTQLRQVVEQ